MRKALAHPGPARTTQIPCISLLMQGKTSDQRRVHTSNDHPGHLRIGASAPEVAQLRGVQADVERLKRLCREAKRVETRLLSGHEPSWA